MSTHREALEQILKVMGPEVPSCSGCEAEWSEALRIAQDALELPLGWQPIETAPDGGVVVLFCDARGNRWSECSFGEHLHDVTATGYPPTHWMPLPPPPGAQDVPDGLVLVPVFAVDLARGALEDRLHAASECGVDVDEAAIRAAVAALRSPEAQG